MRRKVKEVIGCLSEAGLLSVVSLGALDIDTVLADITFDSRNAKQDSLFVCKGKAFREEYLFGAFESGSRLYVADRVITESLPYLLVSDIRVAMSKLAALFFKTDARDVRKIGITGTKGKTTVSVLLNAILDSYCAEQHSKSSALLSSLYVYDGNERKSSKLTTPEAIELWRHLKNAGDHRLPYAVCEVSSQALKYHRVDDVDFEIACFLNIGNDHISEIEHPDFEDYLASKLMIFNSSRIACINSSSDCFDGILAYARQACREVFTFGFSRDDTLYCSTHGRVNGCEAFSVSYRGEAFEEYTTKLFGCHNVENALAAILIAKLLDVPAEHIRSGLLHAEVEGRGVELSSDDDRLRVIVDYAHNGMSLDALYRYVESAYPEYYVITVFGCPGGKAKNRRRDMGTVAALHSDLVILTEDDPAEEPIEAICAEIAAYLDREAVPYLMEYDRGRAIARAFEERSERTVILLCGKGAETTQKRLHGEAPYAGDVAVAKAMLEDYHKQYVVHGS